MLISETSTFTRWIIVTLVIFAGILLTTVPSDNQIDNLQYDLTIAQKAFLSRTDPGTSSKVAVIAVDEDSLERLSDYPRIMLGPVWAQVLDGIAEAGASAVGFDFIFAYPDRYFLPGWETGFLESLKRNGDRVVLARTERDLPAARFQAAFGFAEPDTYLGMVDLQPDVDGVFRNIDWSVVATDPAGNQLTVPTLAALLLKKSGSEPPVSDLRSAPTARLVETIPSYRLAGVLDCIEHGQEDELATIFDGRIVLVGSTLSGEDEAFTTDRFIQRSDVDLAPASDFCGGRIIPGKGRDLVSSVYLHAAAIDNYLAGNTTKPVNESTRLIIVAVSLMVVTLILLGTTGVWTLSLAVLLAFILHAITSLLMQAGYWLPTGSLVAGILAISGFGAFVLLLASESRGLRLLHLFGLYQSEELVDRMMQEETDPVLGGEAREITVMFADFASFTEVSETLAPETLVDLLNEYLGLVSAIVEKHHGYIDKFIGDEVMALWGAPSGNEQHAEDAYAAAVEILDAVALLSEQKERSGAPSFAIRIALNSGSAIVGNVGASNRLSYSAIGTTVNSAARLAGYASENDLHLIIGETTAMNLRIYKELKAFSVGRLKGISAPVVAFVP